MVDLAQQSSTSKLSSILGKLVLIPNIYFIYFTYNLIKTDPQTAVGEFSRMRNLFYIVYVIVFAVIGLLIFILQRQDSNSSVLKHLKIFLPNLVLSLILTTFSYAIAQYIDDLLAVINR